MKNQGEVDGTPVRDEGSDATATSAFPVVRPSPGVRTALAPMATLSHEALRLLIHRFGDPDEFYTEMIHAPSLLAGGKFEAYYVRTAPAPEKIVWQLTGPEADSLCHAAAMLLPLGGLGVDLNMGCSAPAIVRTGAGIAWMSKPVKETAAMVASVRRVLDAGFPDARPSDVRFPDASALPGGFASGGFAPGGAATPCSDAVPRGKRPRLSVKLRLGETADYAALLSFCGALVDAGVELFTLHPRTRREKYSRPAHWDFVARLASDLPVPVFGNGDIFSARQACDVLRAYPCAGLMLGRAAVQRPWIFRDIRRIASQTFPAQSGEAQSAPAQGEAAQTVAMQGGGCDGGASTRIDHLEVCGFFLDCLKQSQPPEFHLSRARRFFSYYCDNFTFAHYARTRLLNAESADEMLPVLAAYFEENPADRFTEPERG